MRLEMSGFIQKDRFDLNSYLTYLFTKLNDHPSQANSKKRYKLVHKWGNSVK
ncbi:hypothetical protein [Bacillus sp. EB600]|uniref:hypothetical protein n=1 Tax=Bacillus sp. EB600 TaxID=2806345 RepID=UPI00210E623C|nr:hypothetical protein [Bacillus sp. EB600]MCQ6280517.1 hypothetical protein [Bacillus sp. EB600]